MRGLSELHFHIPAYIVWAKDVGKIRKRVI